MTVIENKTTGSFLEGTLIETPTGLVAIEALELGDEIISFNLETNEKQVSVINGLDVSTENHYYVLNDTISASGEQYFYINKGIEKIKNFDATHKLINTDSTEVLIGNYTRKDAVVTTYKITSITPNSNYYANTFLVHIEES